MQSLPTSPSKIRVVENKYPASIMFPDQWLVAVSNSPNALESKVDPENSIPYHPIDILSVPGSSDGQRIICAFDKVNYPPTLNGWNLLHLQKAIPLFLMVIIYGHWRQIYKV
jgi:hypothetical protein